MGQPDLNLGNAFKYLATSGVSPYLQKIQANRGTKAWDYADPADAEAAQLNPATQMSAYEAAMLDDPSYAYDKMDPAELQALFDQNKSFAQQSVTTGPALQAALQSRYAQMGDQMAEQYNQLGQGTNAGVFAGALARAGTSAGAEAELQQQMALQNMIGQYFNSGREQAYNQQGQMNTIGADMAKTGYQGRLDTNLANAGWQNTANQANAGWTNEANVAQGGFTNAANIANATNRANTAASKAGLKANRSWMDRI